MSTMRRTTLQPILDAPEQFDDRTSAEAPRPRAPRDYKTVLALAFVVVLLTLVATAQGAFGVSAWAPLALLALAALIGALLTRGALAIRSVPVAVAIASIWLLAGWSLLSMVWAQSPGDAFAAGDRFVFYAAIATLPFVLAFSRRTLVVAGWAVTVGLGAVAVYVEIRLLVHGAPLYLAGRLNGPINYRNATALLFALPAWPGVIAASTRNYRWWVRAGALALTMLCLGLVWTTQSRGIVLGLAVGALPVFAFGPDRVRRAWVAFVAVGGIALASPWLLRPFHASDGGSGYLPPHAITVAAQGLAVLTVAGFCVGLLIALGDKALRPGSAPARVVRWTARIALGGAIVAMIAAAAVAIGNPVTYANQKWDQFRSLQSGNATSTRLGTVSGQRYDLWRVAWKEFESAPILGVGADNYSFDYYRERATNRNLTDPHSVVFSLLSENGTVGIVLFVLFLGGIFGAIASGWRALPAARRRHAMAPAAAGAVMLGQSTVDWIWLIPGLTAIGIFALAVAAAQVSAARDGVADSEPSRASETSRTSSRRRWAPDRVAGSTSRGDHWSARGDGRCPGFVSFRCVHRTGAVRRLQLPPLSSRRRRRLRRSIRGRSRRTISSRRRTRRWASGQRPMASCRMRCRSSRSIQHRSVSWATSRSAGGTWPSPARSIAGRWRSTRSTLGCSSSHGSASRRRASTDPGR